MSDQSARATEPKNSSKRVGWWVLLSVLAALVIGGNIWFVASPPTMTHEHGGSITCRSLLGNEPGSQLSAVSTFYWADSEEVAAYVDPELGEERSSESLEEIRGVLEDNCERARENRSAQLSALNGMALPLLIVVAAVAVRPRPAAAPTTKEAE